MRRTITLATMILALAIPATMATGATAAAEIVGGTARVEDPECSTKTIVDKNGKTRVIEECSGASSGDDSDTTPAAQRERVCAFNGQTIPCGHKEHGIWNGQCYVKKSEPQPPKTDVVWEGRDDGVIVDCFPYLCVQQPDRDNIPEDECVAYQQWLPSLPGTVDPELLARQAIDSMQLQPIEIGIVPDDTPDAIGYVGVPAWFWVVEPAPNTYGPITASANAGGTGVTATAKVDRIEWSLGDGVTVTCDGPGTPYEDRFGLAESPDCGHILETQGDKTITATSYWTVEWTGGGQSGTIPLDLTAETRIRVGELQVLNQ